MLAAVNELLDRNLAENAKNMGTYFMGLLSALPHIKQFLWKAILEIILRVVLNQVTNTELKQDPILNYRILTA